MVLQIAVAGKGGTGKTTFASIAVTELVRHGKKPVLAVDADANANFHEALGLELRETIAEILARLKDDRTPLPAGMTRDQYVEYKVYQSLAEGDDVDLLSMGGPEGPGCYCYANNMLRALMDSLARNYKVVVADNEAGLEHLSRRTTRDVDYLFIISDATARGLRSAGRIKELVACVSLPVHRIYLVITKVQNNELEALQDEINRTGLELAGTVPLDPLIIEFDLHNRPLAHLPGQAPAVVAVRGVLNKLGIL